MKIERYFGGCFCQHLPAYTARVHTAQIVPKTGHMGLVPPPPPPTNQRNGGGLFSKTCTQILSSWLGGYSRLWHRAVLLHTYMIKNIFSTIRSSLFCQQMALLVRTHGFSSLHCTLSCYLLSPQPASSLPPSSCYLGGHIVSHCLLTSVIYDYRIPVNWPL